MPKDKIFRLSLVLFVVVSAVVIWMRGNEFVAVENPDTELQGKAYIKYWDKLNEAYKKDNYGGATPEETLDMFITALKAGDLELASKYFVVEKQPFVLEELRNGIKNGGTNTLIKILDENRTGYAYDYSNSYEFITSESGITLKLLLNTQTNKWKMYDF